jgi:hypothetical protein
VAECQYDAADLVAAVDSTVRLDDLGEWQG